MRKPYIVLEDYLSFMDILYNGKTVDKYKINFMMCDLKGYGMVYYEDYSKFCFCFLGMYEELMQTRIGHHQEETIAEDFDKFVKARGNPKKDSDGGVYFDIDDFNQALKDEPEIFKWIEDPLNYFNEITKQNEQRRNMMKVNRDDVMEYHKRVVNSYDRIIEMINREFNHGNNEIFDLLGNGINPRDPQCSMMI